MIDQHDMPAAVHSQLSKLTPMHADLSRIPRRSTDALQAGLASDLGNLRASRKPLCNLDCPGAPSYPQACASHCAWEQQIRAQPNSLSSLKQEAAAIGSIAAQILGKDAEQHLIKNISPGVLDLRGRRMATCRMCPLALALWAKKAAMLQAGSQLL